MTRRRITPDLSQPCWPWPTPNSNGYGPHRKVYEFFTGRKIPPKMDVDHLCENRACINPWHFDIVPRIVNLRRGKTFAKETIAKRTKTQRAYWNTPEAKAKARANGYKGHAKRWGFKEKVSS